MFFHPGAHGINFLRGFRGYEGESSPSRSELFRPGSFGINSDIAASR